MINSEHMSYSGIPCFLTLIMNGVVRLDTMISVSKVHILLQPK